MSAITVFPQGSEIQPRMNVKFGIDPTLDRLHLGHFVPLRLFKRMVDEGRAGVIVLGTFTAQLGDPSGRDSTRPMLNANDTEKNAKRIAAILRTVLRGDDQFWDKVMFWNNGDLHNDMKVSDFLKLASQFTVAHMLSRDAFQKRHEAGVSIGLHELLVPICQGMDSVFLKTDIEIGGQDQLFNFQVTRQLQEHFGQKPEICLMTPIINGTDGRKMSKSFGNCIFLDEPPNDMFGKVMSISDAVMEEWFPLFVDEPFAKDNPMEKKKHLATMIVAQLHGSLGGIHAKIHFEETVQKKIVVEEDIRPINATNLLEAVVLLRNCGKSAGRRLIAGGGVTVDGNKVVVDGTVTKGQVIKAGKRDFGRIE